MKLLSETPQTDAAEDATLNPDYEYVGAETEAWAFARELEIDRDYYKKALRSAENIVLNYLKDKERLERECNELKCLTSNKNYISS